jgi:methionyl-tRNA formyltransferase
MRKRVLLFINGRLGLDLMRYLLNQPETEISGIVLNSDEKRTPDYSNKIREIQAEFETEILVLLYENEIWRKEKFRSALEQTDLAVVALFGHIIPREVISALSPSIVNLHPSYLPLGRGADPIPWAIIDNEKQGATIHILEERLDTGPIVLQTEIKSDFGMSSGEIYQLAMAALMDLFEQYYESWPEGVTFHNQTGSHSYHSSSELASVREKFLRDSETAENFFRITQALSFSDGRALRIQLRSGEIWEITLVAKQALEQEN